MQLSASLGLLAASRICRAQSPPDNPSSTKTPGRPAKLRISEMRLVLQSLAFEAMLTPLSEAWLIYLLEVLNTLAEQSLDKSAEAVLIFEARITAGGSTRRADHSGAINNNDLRNVQYLLLLPLQVPVHLGFA